MAGARDGVTGVVNGSDPRLVGKGGMRTRVPGSLTIGAGGVYPVTSGRNDTSLSASGFHSRKGVLVAAGLLFAGGGMVIGKYCNQNAGWSKDEHDSCGGTNHIVDVTEKYLGRAIITTGAPRAKK